MKRTLTFLLFVAVLYSWAQPNPQTKKLTNKFFPELDIEINTPAFQKKKGFTKYADLIGFLDSAVAHHPDLIQYSFIGSSQKGNRIPSVQITNSKSSKSKVKVWMQGGLHGDEPASTEGLLYLIDQLLEDPSKRVLLDDLVIRIIPMANIDGFEKQNRYAANGLDLNRDQTKLMAPESVFLKKAFHSFDPEVAVDFHEYRPFRRDFAKMSDWGVSSAFDVMFLYTGNLNVPKELRQLIEEDFVDPAKKAMKENQIRCSDYMSTRNHHGEIQFNVGAVSPRSSASSYALANCVSTLIEVRGVGIGRRSFKRRVFITSSVALSYLESSLKNADKVKSILGAFEQRAVDPVVIKSKREVSSTTIPMIDIGSNELIEMEIITRNALHSKPSLQRDRPKAYLILPTEKDAMEKLKILGLTIRELASEQSIEVEAFTVSKYKRERFPYEGIHPQNIETEQTTKQVSFPAGTYVVYLDQERSNLSVVVLEPEALSGFVHFEVIKTELARELPIYRYIKQENIQGLK